MRAGIIRLGNEQLRTAGASGLSVREIARGLGVVSSAIYRHVANRDELLTLLIVDAYSDMSTTVLGTAGDTAGDAPTESTAITGAARVLTPANDPKKNVAHLEAFAQRMRAWALKNPERWALTYGSPVPGYAAPAERTTEPGTRLMAAFVSLITALPSRETPTPVSAELGAILEAAGQEYDIPAAPAAAADAVIAWMELIGIISAEVFGQLGPDLATRGEELLTRWCSRVTGRP